MLIEELTHRPLYLGFAEQLLFDSQDEGSRSQTLIERPGMG